MATEETRKQELTTRWYKKPQFPWLIISHVVAIMIGGALMMNVMAFNQAQVQSAVDQRMQIATQKSTPKNQ